MKNSAVLTSETETLLKMSLPLSPSHLRVDGAATDDILEQSLIERARSMSPDELYRELGRHEQLLAQSAEMLR